MLERRSFLKSGVAALSVAGSGGLMVSLTAQPSQAIAPALVAVALNPEVVAATISLFGTVLGAILASSIKTNGELDGIKGQLGDFNKKLDLVVANLNSLPEILKRQERDQLVLDMKSKELQILLRASEVLDRKSNAQALDYLKAASVAQEDVRFKLIEGKYGPDVYPYVVRSFTCQALAMRLIGDSEDHFTKCQQYTAVSLNMMSDAFKDFAARAERDYMAAAREWKDRAGWNDERGAGRLYTGTNVTSVWKEDIEYYQVITGDMESGAKAERRTDTANEPYGNSWGWKKTSCLDYRGDVDDFEDGYSVRSLRDRQDAVVACLNDISSRGRNAKVRAANHKVHADATRQFAGKISGMRFA